MADDFVFNPNHDVLIGLYKEKSILLLLDSSISDEEICMWVKQGVLHAFSSGKPSGDGIYQAFQFPEVKKTRPEAKDLLGDMYFSQNEITNFDLAKAGRWLTYGELKQRWIHDLNLPSKNVKAIIKKMIEANHLSPKSYVFKNKIPLESSLFSLENIKSVEANHLNIPKRSSGVLSGRSIGQLARNWADEIKGDEKTIASILLARALGEAYAIQANPNLVQFLTPANFPLPDIPEEEKRFCEDFLEENIDKIMSDGDYKIKLKEVEKLCDELEIPYPDFLAKSPDLKPDGEKQEVQKEQDDDVFRKDPIEEFGHKHYDTNIHTNNIYSQPKEATARGRRKALRRDFQKWLKGLTKKQLEQGNTAILECQPVVHMKKNSALKEAEMPKDRWFIDLINVERTKMGAKKPVGGCGKKS